MVKHDRSASVSRFGKEWHLLCYDSGVPVGGQVFASRIMPQPFVDYDGTVIGRDYGYCCAHLDGQRFIETGELP